MSVELKGIRICNFKSLRELKVDLAQLNVVVGANGSGKTNFIEFFKFLKKLLLEELIPFMPHLEWWSYRNVVWEGREELPIDSELNFIIDGYPVDYRLTFGQYEGAFSMLGEKLTIRGCVEIEKRERLIKITHDEGFVNKNEGEIYKMLDELSSVYGLFTKKKVAFGDLIQGQTMVAPTFFRNLLRLRESFLPIPHRYEANVVLSVVSPSFSSEESAFVLTPQLGNEARLSGVSRILRSIRSSIDRFTVLRHPNMREAKSPSLPKREIVLSEDASNLHNILYNWFMRKGTLPKRIERAVAKLFPGTQISLELTSDGKAFLKVFEKGIELQPPSISDGLYKVLAILTAIETQPSLLAIDELENSLYVRTLEYIIDELRASKVKTIITTHSPVVVDMVKLEDLLLAEKGKAGTTLKRIADPDKMREKLRKIKITQSESWLYGGFSSEDEINDTLRGHTR